jgi:hypothetical protein
VTVREFLGNLTRLTKSGELKGSQQASIMELFPESESFRLIPLQGAISTRQGCLLVVGEATDQHPIDPNNLADIEPHVASELLDPSPRVLPDLPPAIANILVAIADAIALDQYMPASELLEVVARTCRQMSGRYGVDQHDRMIYASKFGDIWRFSQPKWFELMQRVAAGRGYNLGDFGEWVSCGWVDISELNPEQAKKWL